MGFVLKNEKAKTTVIRLEIYVPGEKSRFKYNWEIRKVSSQKFNKAIQEICQIAGFDD